MGPAPSNLTQATLLVLLVLPGVTYQFLRERMRGPVSGERNLGERVLRAVAASVLLGSLYLAVAGSFLIRLLRGDGRTGWNGLVQRPEAVGLTALVLLVVVPAAAAFGVSLWERRRRPAGYRSNRTAWDHMFRTRGSCFVRVRLKDGTWIGGWYGSNSYATSYPEPEGLYLESAWRMRPDGAFTGRVGHTAGLYLRGEDADIVELVHALPQEE
ncbi:hypothetical protein D5S17_15265 [Pseudonocardiaceae bacterium YIM PH 21723]|nr:hypothetical protein D5S17_15265 [Pseudonocardiaceae bacterium YIM PH 21723]